MKLFRHNYLDLEMKLLLQGGTNSATGRRLNSVDRHFLGNYLQLVPAKKNIKDKLLHDKSKSDSNLPT